MLVCTIVSSISYFANKKSQLFIDLKSFIKKKKQVRLKFEFFPSYITSLLFNRYLAFIARWFQKCLHSTNQAVNAAKGDFFSLCKTFFSYFNNVYILPTRLLMQLKETYSPSSRLFFIFQHRLHSTNQAVKAAKGDFFSLCNTFFCQWEHHLHVCHGIICVLCGIIIKGGEGRHFTTCYKNIKY